jgi:hypothetical protein
MPIADLPLSSGTRRTVRDSAAVARHATSISGPRRSYVRWLVANNAEVLTDDSATRGRYAWFSYFHYANDSAGLDGKGKRNPARWPLADPRTAKSPGREHPQVRGWRPLPRSVFDHARVVRRLRGAGHSYTRTCCANRFGSSRSSATKIASPSTPTRSGPAALLASPEQPSPHPACGLAPHPRGRGGIPGQRELTARDRRRARHPPPHTHTPPHMQPFKSAVRSVRLMTGNPGTAERARRSTIRRFDPFRARASISTRGEPISPALARNLPARGRGCFRALAGSQPARRATAFWNWLVSSSDAAEIDTEVPSRLRVQGHLKRPEWRFVATACVPTCRSAIPIRAGPIAARVSDMGF